MNSGSDQDFSLSDANNGDILFKINSILHNKLDLGCFLGPDANNNNSNPITSSGSGSSRGQEQVGGLSSSQASTPTLGGRSYPNSSCLSPSALSESMDLRRRPDPLSLESGGSRLSEFLGVSSPKKTTTSDASVVSSANSLRSGGFKGNGEFKYPDVSSPVNKLMLSPRDLDDMLLTSSPNHLLLSGSNGGPVGGPAASPSSSSTGSRLRFGSLGATARGESSMLGPSSAGSSTAFNFNTLSGPPTPRILEAGDCQEECVNNSSSGGSFEEALLLNKWDHSGDTTHNRVPGGRHSSSASSPGSDGAYGSSYTTAGNNSSSDNNRGEDTSGLSELFKSLGFSDTSQIAGLLGAAAASSHSSSNNNNTMDYFNRSSSGDLCNPNVAQAVKNIQNLQSFQALYNSNSSNYSGGDSVVDTTANTISTSSSSGAAVNTSVSLERAARIHRNGTAIYDASCTWHGTFPQKKEKNLQFSCKVFLGGVPWDITEASLLATFKPFGPIKIEWPGKDNSSVPRGYLYIIFENEKQVKDLLGACTHDYSNGGSCYYKISSRRMRNKEVQVIPWIISDSNFVRCPSQRLDPKKTVFVGALHGMLTAEGLCSIFHDLFGGVVYAGVDTDKYKYPQGSGRVTFNNHRSYMKAVSAAFIEIKAPKFTKKVQVDPYLEDELCSFCSLRQGPYFCRDVACFKYFCRYCWELYHGTDMSHHSPLMRNSKPNCSSSTRSNIPFSE